MIDEDQSKPLPPNAFNCFGISPLCSLEDKKQAILTIEGACHSIKNGSFPLEWYQTMLSGFMFLKNLHDRLLASFTPEELEAFRKEQSTNPVTGTPQTNGKPTNFMGGLRQFLGKKH